MPSSHSDCRTRHLPLVVLALPRALGPVQEETYLDMLYV